MSRCSTLLWSHERARIALMDAENDVAVLPRKVKEHKRAVALRDRLRRKLRKIDRKLTACGL